MNTMAKHWAKVIDTRDYERARDRELYKQIHGGSIVKSVKKEVHRLANGPWTYDQSRNLVY